MKSFFQNFRLNLTIAALLCCFSSIFAQTVTTTHVVDRGETLESIASKYGVTTDQLIELNPAAKDFVYVGMELIVPSKATSTVTPSAPVASSSSSPFMSAVPASSTAYDGDSYHDPDGPGFTPCFSIEFGFLPKNKDANSNTNYTYGVTVGTNYYFLEKSNKIYAGAAIGYNSFNYSMRYSDGHGTYLDKDLTAHCIAIPFKVGYAIRTSDKKFGITPLIGLDLNCIVSSKSKFKGKDPYNGKYEQTSKEEKGVAAGFRASLQIDIAEFNIGASYIFNLNDKQKYYAGDDGYFAINIGWGF